MHASAYLFSPTSLDGKPKLGVGLRDSPVRVPQPVYSGGEAPGRLASGRAPVVVLSLHSQQRSACANLRSAFSDVEKSAAGQVPAGADLPVAQGRSTVSNRWSSPSRRCYPAPSQRECTRPRLCHMSLLCRPGYAKGSRRSSPGRRCPCAVRATGSRWSCPSRRCPF